MKEGGSKGELGGRKEAGRRPIVGLQQTVRARDGVTGVSAAHGDVFNEPLW